MRTAREVKAHAPHCRVIFTVYEMKRLGRDAAELTALADHLTAHGLILEILAGPPPGIYDPAGPGKLLLAFFAAMAETERGSIRESRLEGLDTAARKGKSVPAGRGGASVGEAGGGGQEVLPAAHHTLRRRHRGEHMEHLHLEARLGSGRVIPPRTEGRKPGGGQQPRKMASMCFGTPVPRSCWKPESRS
ncbi:MULTISPECIES: recombinase family protein [unclassified Streptomyces]|uniref:recombinase family protein n=1 Tax=unclassified Streptomyces TaxID=2593676 RepID=UPI00382A201C